MGNEIEVKGIIGLDPLTEPLTNDQTKIENSQPKQIRMQTSVSKQYPQTNDQVDTQLQLTGIWLVLLVLLLWAIRKSLTKETVGVQSNRK